MSSGREDQTRKSGYIKKGIDETQARRRLASNTISIRKNKRMERFQKQRRQADGRRPGSGSGSEGDDEHPKLESGLTESTPYYDPETAVVSKAVGYSVIYDKKHIAEYEPREFPKLLSAIHSNNPTYVITATAHFRKLLSIEHSPPISDVIALGVHHKFIEFLKRDDDPALQFEAAWALTNIASGTSEHTHECISAGVVPLFVRLLSSPNEDVREQAVWGLGNISGDSPRCRDYVLDHHALNPLLQCLKSARRLNMLRNATWALSNLCRGKPAPDFALVRPCLKVLARLIFTQDAEVLTDSCWALSYLSESSNEKIQAVIEAGVCKRLVELLVYPSFTVQTPALRTIGNIVTGDDPQTQSVLEAGALPALVSILQTSPRQSLKKEACWTISNITAGSRVQIQRAFDAGAVPPLISHLSSTKEYDFDLRKEAAWALSNACTGGTEIQILFLVTSGTIPPFCDLLEVKDSRMISIALESLELMLTVGRKFAQRNGSRNQVAILIQKCDGLEKIRALQYTGHQSIYMKASQILDQHFKDEDSEDEATLPAANDDQFLLSPPEGNGDFSFDD